MTVKEIRAIYLKFFKERGHHILPSASLIPENDPSVLFTTAGMHPLVPFLMGEKHPAGQRLVSSQKCIRTGDIEDIGDNHHLTFFEMLGNWSLGDYWKEDSIKWSWEFLTSKEWLGLNPKNFAVSVFKGDKDCSFDEESYQIWKNLGIEEGRIARLGKEDNWWPTGGKNPCPQGPDTEIFYWTGKRKVPAKFDPDDKSWFEIWNNVFMEYERTEHGKYQPLKQRNVDTGMGLERTAAVLQHKDNLFEIESFKPLMNFIKKNAQAYDEASARIIADHLRAAIFIMSDNTSIVPSNLRQGYIVRRLIRRAIRHAKKINIPLDTDLSTPFVNEVAKQYQDVYPEIARNKDKVINELKKEEENFEKTLEKGLREFNKLADHEITGQQAFNLYATYGFPIEVIEELAEEKDIQIDKKAFEKEFTKHQKSSRSASAGMFKGGLVGQSENTIKYHTATHLLHQALRQVLGDHVEQKGSNITDDRLRFDFSHSEKMTDEQKKLVEDMVNQKIKEALPVTIKELSFAEAKKHGAIGLFADKYGDQVKVYSIGDFSKEICGGPHVKKTSELGEFKIKKEESSSRGVRRIRAVLK